MRSGLDPDPTDNQSRNSAPGSDAATRLVTAARMSAAATIGILSLLLNPLFVAPAIGVAALVVRAQRRRN
jgi:hypothetical protein